MASVTIFEGPEFLDYLHISNFFEYFRPSKPGLQKMVTGWPDATLIEACIFFGFSVPSVTWLHTFDSSGNGSGHSDDEQNKLLFVVPLIFFFVIGREGHMSVSLINMDEV